MEPKDRLKQWMKQQGLSQREFAAEHGFSEPLVSMWLSGANKPGLPNAFRLQDITGGFVPAASWSPRRRRHHAA